MRLIVINIALSLLYLAIPAQAAKPVIVRSKFNDRAYFVFVPADDAGRYWSRWTLDNPQSARTTSFPIHDVHYGRIRPGRWQNYADASDESGTWTVDVRNYWQTVKNSVLGSYLEWDIPDGHNRIHVLMMAYGTRLMTVSMSDGGGDVSSELDDTSIGDGTNAHIKEYIVATTSTSVDRKLRLTKSDKDGKSVYVIGIHSFDDDSNGDPTTVVAGTEGYGHDLVDIFHSQTDTTFPLEYDQVVGHTNKLLYSNTTELTIKWKPEGQASTKWTAYGSHYSVINAPFTATTDATLYIDGVSQGTMDDTANVARAELHEADSIVAIVEGYGDYDRDGVEDAEDILKVRISQDFTKTGVGIAIRIKWTGYAVVDLTGPYVPSVCIDSSMTGVIKLLPDETEVTIGSCYTGKKANAVAIYPDQANCIIITQSLGPVEEIFEWQEGNNKMYFKLKDELLEGGNTPADGDIWTLGAFIAIRNQERIPGDLNNDSKVDFADFTIFAEHWLDCNLDPPEACWE